MRTMLTLDDDVAAMLEQAKARAGGDFKRLINDLLRVGLKQAIECTRPAMPYRTPSTDAGQCLVGSIADIQAVLSEAEGPTSR